MTLNATMMNAASDCADNGASIDNEDKITSLTCNMNLMEPLALTLTNAMWLVTFAALIAQKNRFEL